VVLFFEIILVGMTVVISWFALYTLYRLITDESLVLKRARPERPDPMTPATERWLPRPNAPR